MCTEKNFNTPHPPPIWICCATPPPISIYRGTPTPLFQLIFRPPYTDFFTSTIPYIHFFHFCTPELPPPPQVFQFSRPPSPYFNFSRPPHPYFNFACLPPPLYTFKWNSPYQMKTFFHSPKNSMPPNYSAFCTVISKNPLLAHM